MRPLVSSATGYNVLPPFGPPPRMPPSHLRGSAGIGAGARGGAGPLPLRGPPPMGLMGPVPPPRELISVPTNLQEEAIESGKRSVKEAGLDPVRTYTVTNVA